MDKLTIQVQNGVRDTRTFIIVALIEIYHAILEGVFQGKDFKPILNEMEQELDDKKRKMKKTSLPLVLQSAWFLGKRVVSAAQHHLGLYECDIDVKDNPQIQTRQGRGIVIEALRECSHFALIFVSPRGGIKAILRGEAKLSNHSIVFDAISKWMRFKYNLTIDSRARSYDLGFFLSFDPQAYFNGEATEFNHWPWLEVKKQDDLKIGASYSLEGEEIPNEVLQLTELLEKQDIDITQGYPVWLKLAYFFSSYGESGREIFHRVSKIYSKYNEQEANEQFDACLSNNDGKVKLGTFIRYCSLNGVNIPNNTTSNSKREGKEESYVDDQDEEHYLSLNKSKTLGPGIYKFLDEDWKNALKCLSTEREKDVFLLALMTCCSGIFKSLSGYFDGELVSPNLYMMIVAPQTAGKGIATKGEACVHPIDTELRNMSNLAAEEFENSEVQGKKTPFRELLVPGNISSSALMKKLSDNNGSVIFSESESDTVGNVLQKDFGDYSDIFRKAFHNERVSQSRRTKDENLHIKRPMLSVLLTGTPSQIGKIIQSKHDGLLSRFCFYLFGLSTKYRSPFNKKKIELNQWVEVIGESLLKRYKEFDKESTVLFRLTEEQEGMFYEQFSKWVDDAIQKHGEIGAALTYRLGLICFRIAMVFTAYRYGNKDELICDEREFKLAMNLVSRLRQHSFMLLELLPEGDVTIKTKTSSTYKVSPEELSNQLPKEFTTNQAEIAGEKLGIGDRQVARHLVTLCEQGKIIRYDKGKYRKL